MIEALERLVEKWWAEAAKFNRETDEGIFAYTAFMEVADELDEALRDIR
jgi:hypothetical protein